MREGSIPSTPTTPTIHLVDEHADHAHPPAQPATASSERERELAVIARFQTDLADVDRALQRLDDGTYETCEVCGQAIGDDVLERAPATRLCAAHGVGGAPTPAAPTAG
jgi:DnaK suppressor protein